MSDKARIEGRTAGFERLRRLLFLVPFVSKRQGITVDELAAALGVTRDDLLEDLDLLTLVGRPPFQPDDCIDIYVEKDKVFVHLDQRLSAPPRLTASEAAALAAAAELLRPGSGDALSTALAKLEAVLPPNARERFREMERKIDAGERAPSELFPLSSAISQRREVGFDYFSPERGTTERRQVRPRELFNHRGQWYLSGFDVARNDERLFRLDRIQSLAVSDTTFEPADGSPTSVPNPAKGSGEVRVRFSRAVAPYVRERFGDDARPGPEGGVEVKVSGTSERWLTQWVLSFGGDAVVVEPEWAREVVARAARASLESQP